MLNEETLRIAAAQYPIDFLKGWQAYRDKAARLVGQAARQGARLLVFPEYAAMELASLFPQPVYSNLEAQLLRLQELLPEYLEVWRDLALEHKVCIAAGSFPAQVDKEYRNRAYIFTPDGEYDFQEKLVMTRFESERWLVRRGSGIKVFETRFARIGINVCYDAEFPLIARKQIEAGAQIILVPSCTDTLAGYHRVRIACQARALENQCFVVQSPTVGEASWSEAVDINVGAAGVFVPSDYGFPNDGVLARGELNKPQWVVADLQLDALERVRSSGQVFNHRDWNYQREATAGDVETVALF